MRQPEEAGAAGKAEGPEVHTAWFVRNFEGRSVWLPHTVSVVGSLGWIFLESSRGKAIKCCAEKHWDRESSYFWNVSIALLFFFLLLFLL